MHTGLSPSATVKRENPLGLRARNAIHLRSTRDIYIYLCASFVCTVYAYAWLDKRAEQTLHTEPTSVCLSARSLDARTVLYNPVACVRGVYSGCYVAGWSV